MTGQKESTSVVVVHAADFLDALRCAVIFTDQHAFPGVRVDINPDDLCVEVSARVKNHITATTGGIAWCKVVDEDRDLSFELSIKQVRDLLQVFKNYDKRPAEEEAPQIGIHLSENEITWYDETGLGLAVYLYGCPRVEIDTPSLFHVIDTSADDIVAEMPVQLSLEQLGELHRVAKIMGVAPTIVGMPQDEAAHLHRHVVLCDRFRSVASVPIEHDSAESDGESVEQLHLDEECESRAKVTLRVVSSNPTGGIA